MNDFIPAENYTDMSGNLRTFTHVDHDKKTKISSSIPDANEAKENLDLYRTGLIDRLLALPASLCPVIFHDYTIRGEVDVITWNEKLIRDPRDYNTIRDIAVLIENKQK